MESRILTDDLQASSPDVRIGLSRVGVTGVSKAIRLSHRGREKLISARIECTVDLDASQKGVHMSRFPELFEEAIDEVVIGEALLVEVLAEHIARHIAERQRALRAEVRIDARYLLKRPDELFVVEHAHLQPRFAEDSVRLALAGVLDAYPALDDADFLFARQVNLETIHTHDVIAERSGTVGELRAELEESVAPARHTELREWLALGQPR